VDDLDDVFADGAVVDFSNGGGDTFLDKGYLEQSLSIFAAIQHYMMNFAIDVHGDTATARHYTLADGVDRRRRRSAPRRRRLYDLSSYAPPTAGVSRSSSRRSSGSTANGPRRPRPGWWGRPTDSAASSRRRRACTSASTPVAAT
jgi:hypothetical protein